MRATYSSNKFHIFILPVLAAVIALAVAVGARAQTSCNPSQVSVTEDANSGTVTSVNPTSVTCTLPLGSFSGSPPPLASGASLLVSWDVEAGQTPGNTAAAA